MPTILTETRECHVYCYNKRYALYLEDFAADLGIREELLSLKMKETALARKKIEMTCY